VLGVTIPLEVRRFLGVNLVLKTVRQRNMREQARDAARSGSCPEAYFFFVGCPEAIVHVFLADGAKSYGKSLARNNSRGMSLLNYRQKILYPIIGGRKVYMVH